MTSIYPSTSSTSSKTSSTSSANLLRISGMSSGIDTDAVVKSMVAKYQNKIDKANQDKQTVQWKQAAYRDIIKGVKGLQDYFDPLSSKYMLSEKSLNTNTATSDTTSVVSATSESTAKTGTYKINVSQLAEQARITGTTSLNSLVDATAPASEQLTKWNGATLKLDTNLKLDTITDANANGTLDETVANINIKISADSTLNGKVKAVLNGSDIEFQNTSDKPITLTLTSSDGVSKFNQDIAASSSYKVVNTDFSAWSNANLTLSNSITLGNTIANTDNNASGSTMDEIVANINSNISQNSILSGNVSASYVNGGIKFTSVSAINLTATTSSGTAGDIFLNKSISASGTYNYNQWNGATLKLDTNLKLDAITDISGLVANINSKIAADSTLSGKIVASYNTSTNKIEIENKSSSSISLTAKGSTQDIVKGSPISFDVADDAAAANWSQADLTFSNSIKLGDTIADTDTNTSGSTMDEIVANINSNISQNSILSGNVSASYVNDGSGKSYIKFTSSSSMNLSATTSGGTTGDIINKSINSGISSNTKLSDLGITSSSGFSLSYGSTTSDISVASTDTLQTLIDQVNSKTSGAVTMSIDDTTGIISFQSKGSGSKSNITISNLSGDINKLGIVADSKIGKDAIVEITEPGKTVATTTTQSSNSFTVNGVAYNLVGTSAGKTANVTVTANSDTVVTNVKKFIEDYNTIISTINTKLTEKKDRGYAPLTDAQKESMSETQITAWETKAKVGILRNDEYLSSLMTQLRGAFSTPVYSSYTDSTTNTKISLNIGKYGSGAVGIDTSSTDYADGGKLYVKDEAKLKNAIENNIDDFKKLFIGASDSTLDANKAYVGSKKYNEDGIFKRMDTILRDYVASPGIGKDGTYTLSGSMNIFVNKQYDFSSSGSSGKNTLPDQVYSKTQSMSRFQTQLSNAQTRYYAKFTALETAMSKLNSQQSQLSSMLGTS